MLKIKKILLILVLTLCIFQLVVLATEIIMGNEAIDRGSTISGRTLIDGVNPADADGTITQIELYPATDMTYVQFAIFYSTGENTFSTRDYVEIGSVAGGEKHVFTEDSGENPISLSVVAGDYIGVYFSVGDIERDQTAGRYAWYAWGDNIPCTDVTCTAVSNYTISLKGIGATEEEEGVTHIFFTFSDF